MKLDFRFIITYSDGTQSVLPLKDGQTGLRGSLYGRFMFSSEEDLLPRPHLRHHP